VGFRTRIKEYRARYDMTQEELALKVGVRRETISFLERGVYMPSLQLAYDVAQVFNTTIEEVFIFYDEKTEKKNQK
jgi:putative transcriptional regulator